MSTDNINYTKYVMIIQLFYYDDADLRFDGRLAQTINGLSNSRDVSKNTEDGRGLDVNFCRKMLAKAGFSGIWMGDGNTKPFGH